MSVNWGLSKFGENLCGGSGIGELMDDLGEALAAGGDVKMLGGGQPAHIPEIDAVWRHRMQEIMSEPGGLEKMIGNYDVPAGSDLFRKALAKLFQKEFGWKLLMRILRLRWEDRLRFSFYSTLWQENLVMAPKKRFYCH